MIDAKRIGRKTTLKYGLIGFLVLGLTPLIIGLCMFYVSDRPLNIGAKTNVPSTFGMILLFIPIVGWVLSRAIGGWAGTKILDKARSPYLISSVSLILILGGMTAMLGSFVAFAGAVFVSLLLGLFMGSEIKRKGEMGSQDQPNNSVL